MSRPPRTVLYVDLGFTSTRQFWIELGLPAYERFKAGATRQTIVEASMHSWHVHEWAWHEQNLGQDNGRDPGKIQFQTFQANLISQCEELAWVRDIADATKHSGLGRGNVEVQRMRPPHKANLTGQLLNGKQWVVNLPATMELSSGDRAFVADVLKAVVTFWNGYFAV